MRLQLMTWPEVEAYLQDSRGVIVPVGATEQHGPTGPLGTDAICAETLAWGVGEACAAAVAPTIAVGMSVHHMAFPGSMTLRPSTLLLVVRDVILALARHGFDRFWFLNGHGGNTPTLEAAFFEVHDQAPALIPGGARLRCRAVAWWECEAAERLSQELFGDRDGDHATAGEISLALRACPELAAIQRDAPSGLAPTGPLFGPDEFRRHYPDGRMGSDPSLASAAHGETLYAAIVEELATQYRAFLAEE